MPSLKKDTKTPSHQPIKINGSGKADGKTQYWRSKEQLEDDPGFEKWLHREFPEGASELNDPVTRRSFLSVMGASMALAGLTGCRRPVEKIVPYVHAPEFEVLGAPTYFASAIPLGTSSIGVVIETHEGRPTKVEGNELHPSSFGGTDIWTQASILNLYDPDRVSIFTEKGALRSWETFVEAWRSREPDLLTAKGKGLAVISESFSSPTMSRLQKAFMRRFPQAKFVAWEPVSESNRDAGLTAAAGSALRPSYELDVANVVVSLDMDFLQTEADSARNARLFARGRRVMSPHDEMNRLYVVESMHSTTGGRADHRMRLPSWQIGAFTAALALELEKQGLTIAGSNALTPYATHSFDREWLTAMAEDLIANRGKSIVLAGRRQGPAVHALVYAINSALGNVGKTVTYSRPAHEERSNAAELEQLALAMEQGEISDLVILGGDPAYNAPPELKFAERIEAIPFTVHLTTLLNETARRCAWNVSRTHTYEQWGDLAAGDGTLSIIQPMIEPLFKSKSEVELLNLLATGEDVRGYEIVRSTWDSALTADERAWRRALHDGVLTGSASSTTAPRPNARSISRLLADRPLAVDEPTLESMEVIFTASPSLYDGRFANNAWLQETPDPVTKMTWDNAALISPATAKALGVEQYDEVKVRLGEKEILLAAVVVPGMADNSIALELGYGQTGIGRVADGSGVNVYPLRSLKAMDMRLGATVTRTGRQRELSDTQMHGAMEGRALIREATLETYREHPKFAQEMVHVPDLQSLWKEHTWSEGYQWGMVVDLNVCTGCNACVTACQSENNVPVVGRDQVLVGREMHWLRMDRYYIGDAEEARVATQPVMCQHCEMAPCEQVCPVNATVHDAEGLNMMTYNRCIGTRYCSNNCPYKVRRFNFFNFTKDTPELVKMANNPEVTVRSRGVMEKCSYCLQRINFAKHRAKMENREVRDGEMKTACQQACPSEAITFGNINDPGSKVAELKKNDRNYGMLSEFNTRPRTTYMARLHNPNPKLPAPVFEVEFVPHEGGHESEGVHHG